MTLQLCYTIVVNCMCEVNAHVTSQKQLKIILTLSQLVPVLNPLDDREAAGQRKLPAAAMKEDGITLRDPLHGNIVTHNVYDVHSGTYLIHIWDRRVPY